MNFINLKEEKRIRNRVPPPVSQILDWPSDPLKSRPPVIQAVKALNGPNNVSAVTEGVRPP